MNAMLKMKDDVPLQLVNEAYLNNIHFIYQPIFNVAQHKPFGYEALLRSDVFSPEEFFLRMKSNRERELHWSFALLQVMQKLVESKSNAKISVNCEQQDVMEPWFVSSVLDAIEFTGANPRQIIIELTEHNGVYDHVVAKRNLQTLSAKGITIALDDFGIKHANFDALCFLPVGEIKLDSKFVWNIDNTRCAKSIEAMVRLAGSMNIDVVVEGVETRHQVRQLSSLGIRLMQGFFFSPGEKEINGKELITKIYGESINTNRKNNSALTDAASEKRNVQ